MVMATVTMTGTVILHTRIVKVIQNTCLFIWLLSSVAGASVWYSSMYCGGGEKEDH